MIKNEEDYMKIFIICSKSFYNEIEPIKKIIR